MNGNSILDKRAETLWGKANISYKNYSSYIDKKVNRYQLSLIDLLYISNFKGGNASIHGEEEQINNKLISYSEALRVIGNGFKGKALAELSNEEIENLISRVTDICNLTHKGKETYIYGFGVSYLSALLSSYFPKLIPILDRRVLMNLSLVKKDDINTQNQIRDIQRFYEPLIKNIAAISRERAKLFVRLINKFL
jgi:hypothetical protein